MDKRTLESKFYYVRSTDSNSGPQKVPQDLMIRENVRSLIEGSNIENEKFAILKTRHSIVEIITGDEPAYWPIELSLVIFNLRDGRFKEFTTLINTRNVPLGYDYDLKETIAATGLPHPATIDSQAKNQGFDSSNENYDTIVSLVLRLIELHLNPIDGRYILLALNDEIESTRGVLKWLIKNMFEHVKDDRAKRLKVLDQCVFFPMESFFAQLALRVRSLNPEYRNTRFVTRHGFKEATDFFSTLSKDFELVEKIVCPYHYQFKDDMRGFECCRYKGLNEMLAIFKEFCPYLGIPESKGHDFRQFPNMEF